MILEALLWLQLISFSLFLKTKKKIKQGFDYHMDLGGLGPARFAVEEFNKLKVYMNS